MKKQGNTKQMLFEMMAKINPGFVIKENLMLNELAEDPSYEELVNYDDNTLKQHIISSVEKQLAAKDYYDDGKTHQDGPSRQGRGGYSYSSGSISYKLNFPFDKENLIRTVIHVSQPYGSSYHPGNNYDMAPEGDEKWGDGEVQEIYFTSEAYNANGEMDQDFENRLNGFIEDNNFRYTIEGMVEPYFQSGP